MKVGDEYSYWRVDSADESKDFKNLLSKLGLKSAYNGDVVWAAPSDGIYQISFAGQDLNVNGGLNMSTAYIGNPGVIIGGTSIVQLKAGDIVTSGQLQIIKVN